LRLPCAADLAASADFFAGCFITSSSRKSLCKLKKSREYHATGDLTFDLLPIVALLITADSLVAASYCPIYARTMLMTFFAAQS
jgi:hypothetical protein